MMKRGPVTVVSILTNAYVEGRISQNGQQNEEGRINHCIQHNSRSDDAFSVDTSASQTTNLFRGTRNA